MPERYRDTHYGREDSRYRQDRNALRETRGWGRDWDDENARWGSQDSRRGEDLYDDEGDFGASAYLADRDYRERAADRMRGDRDDVRFGPGYGDYEDAADAYGGYGQYDAGQSNRGATGSRRDYRRRDERYGAYGSGYGSYGRVGGGRDWTDRAADEARSWFGDDDARRRRNWDRLRGGDSHRGRGPRGYARSDERVQEDVSDRLTEDHHIDASDISVDVKSGEVTLNGTVKSRFEKRHAEDIIEDCAGVKHVQNNIRVAEQTQQPGARGKTGRAGNDDARH